MNTASSKPLEVNTEFSISAICSLKNQGALVLCGFLYDITAKNLYL